MLIDASIYLASQRQQHVFRGSARLGQTPPHQYHNKVSNGPYLGGAFSANDNHLPLCREIVWDRNDISIKDMQEVAAALEQYVCV